MDRSAIILAEGSQGKFNEDRGLLKLDNKPLLNHVVDTVKGIVGEVLVVTSSKEQSDLYAKIVSSANVQFAISVDKSKDPLAGASTGFKAAQGKYSLLLPFDAPFVSKEVVSLLFDCCIGKSAVIPRWPSRQIEPLHAVYHTEQALEAAEEALASGELEVEVMVSKMRGVRYLSTLVIEQLDPDFRTFFKIKSPLDLRKAVAMAKPRKTKSRQ
ncbi:MAG: NTP transferase domain-containing protein [Candidatus Bathyarchaeia archaeon]